MKERELANQHLVFKCVAGSHAYGTSTPASDFDTRGVFIAPPEYSIGLKTVDQVESKDPDEVIYEFDKFVQLCMACNPNIIELLFTGPENIQVIKPPFQKLRDNAHLFLSTKARHTFSGYAMAQLKRIRGHNKWISQENLGVEKLAALVAKNKVPSEWLLERFPTRILQRLVNDRYLLEIPQRKDILGGHVLEDWDDAYLGDMDLRLISSVAPPLSQFCTIVQKSGSSRKLGSMDFGRLAKDCLLVKTKGEYCFRIFTVWPEDRERGFRPGFINEDGTQLKYIDIDETKLDALEKRADRFVGILLTDLEAFKEARKNWKDFWTWKENRNEARASLEEQYGFDCYSDDTEFLTRTGWKRFDDIGQTEEVATMHPLTMKVEYQYPYCRHDAIYTGKMYNFTGHHTDINVSGNHRMFVRQYSKNSGTFGQWEFRQACLLPGSFQIVSKIKPCQRKFSNPQPCGADLRFYLKLMGWYVAEGHVCKRLKDETASVLSVSQIEGGNLHWKISRSLGDYEDEIKRLGMSVSHFRYDLKPTETKENRAELRWTFAHREIAQKISSECGTRSEDKRLPRWVFDLSQRMMEILLDAMLGGDGTDNRPHDAHIYYTSSSQLADDVNELAFLCGFETSKWGPYDGMYHVHINKTGDEVRTLHNANVKVTNVKGQRIVCFSVPNEILITRRNGRIGIQGNTKHASHLVRLMRMAEEILRDGKVIVRRPDAQELRDIRNGKFDYDELISWADSMDQRLEELEKSSPIPHSVDQESINKLMMEIKMDYWKEQGML